jgi:ribosomal protein S18 acetylase RimI-like enzyme
LLYENQEYKSAFISSYQLGRMKTLNAGHHIMVDITIRRFKTQDYLNIIKLWDRAGLSYRPEGRDSLKNIKTQINNGKMIFLVAEANNAVVGCILGTHDGRKGWINRLAVDPEIRRRRIAYRLVKVMEREFDELGLEVIACLIEKNNTISKNVFEKLGYEYYPVDYYSKRKSPKS